MAPRLAQSPARRVFAQGITRCVLLCLPEYIYYFGFKIGGFFPALLSCKTDFFILFIVLKTDFPSLCRSPVKNTKYRFKNLFLQKI